jgi:hypothetical protein
MAEASSTTWKFVTTIPSDRMMKPVPTAFPVPEPPKMLPTAWIRLVTFTTAGATRRTTCTVASPDRVVAAAGFVGGNEGAGVGLPAALVRTATSTGAELHAASRRIAAVAGARIQRILLMMSLVPFMPHDARSKP